MKKLFLLMSVLVAILLVVSSCGQSQSAEAPLPHEHEKATFRVEVSRYGFNQTPGEFRFEVEEGQEVEITFVYGDDDLAQNNPHSISVPNYGIKTSVLDRDNPEVTLRFTARETGEVAFMCVLADCTGHHNLHTIHDEDEHAL